MFTDQPLFMERAGITVPGTAHIIIRDPLRGGLVYITILIQVGVLLSVLDLADLTYGWVTDGTHITVMDIGEQEVIVEVTDMVTGVVIVPDIMPDDEMGYYAGRRDANRRNMYRNQGNRNIYNKTDNIKRNRDVTRQQDRKRTNFSTKNKNNVYSDKNGNVHRKTKDGWEQKNKNGWTKDKQKIQNNKENINRDKSNKNNVNRNKNTNKNKSSLNKDYSNRQKSNKRYNNAPKTQNRTNRSSGNRNRSGGGRRR